MRFLATTSKIYPSSHVYTGESKPTHMQEGKRIDPFVFTRHAGPIISELEVEVQV